MKIIGLFLRAQPESSAGKATATHKDDLLSVSPQIYWDNLGFSRNKTTF